MGSRALQGHKEMSSCCRPFEVDIKINKMTDMWFLTLNITLAPCFFTYQDKQTQLKLMIHGLNDPTF